MIIQYHDDNNTFQISDFRILSDTISSSIEELKNEFNRRYHPSPSSSPESSSNGKAEKTDMLFNPLKDIQFLLQTFGNKLPLS